MTAIPQLSLNHFREARREGIAWAANHASRAYAKPHDCGLGHFIAHWAEPVAGEIIGTHAEDWPTYSDERAEVRDMVSSLSVFMARVASRAFRREVRP